MDLLDLPDALPLLTTTEAVLPGSSQRLAVSSPRGMQLVRHLVRRSAPSVLFATISRDAEEAEGSVGCAVLCSQVISTNWPQPHYQLLVTGLCRVRVEHLTASEPFPTAKISQVDTRDAAKDYQELTSVLREAVDKLLSLLGRDRGSKLRTILREDELANKVDALVGLLGPSERERRELLEALDPKERLETALTIVNDRIQRLQQRKLRPPSVSHRGPRSGPEEVQDEVAELAARITAAGLPEEASKVMEKELSRLRQMPASLPEFALMKTYLEFVADLPWKEPPAEAKIRMSEAKAVLDADHFGLEKPKRRILEFLAVRQLKNSLRGPILCLVGPPGVGKTSIGRSVARTLGRKFHRLSLGGVCDQSEIRGHRRTYVGAMPGRILQGLKTVGVRNPVMLLDEIDKLSKGVQGDPASALLEVLDPEQNCTFVDHFLNVPFDLSQVLFIATANSAATIPPALLDRMEVIELTGYTEEEKVRITEDHLLPKQLAEHGLTSAEMTLPTESVQELIASYTREAGVRTLERRLAALCRAVAIRVAELREVASNSQPSSSSPIPFLPFVLDSGALSDILGPPRPFAESAPSELGPGVAVGLAWTPHGGSLMIVEASRMPGEEKLQLTGQLGEVMKESAILASTWLRAHCLELNLDAEAISGALHLHFPAGAIAKDGPSAGVAIVTALVSLFSGHCARPDTAMTGEITLRGLVLPVGGIKEKVLAAARAGLKRVILPAKNEPDLTELPASISSTISIIFASRIEEVLREALHPDVFDASRSLIKRSKL